MPVRKASADEMLGGKSIVMSANPAIIRGFKRLEESRRQIGRSAEATGSRPKKS